MSAQLDARCYFQQMEDSIRADAASLWLEAFCQRSMLMRSYSTRNVALILTQFPEATYVAGRSQFKDKGVDVFFGATPIYITAPKASRAETQAGGFSWATVYDISQTTAHPRKPRPKEALEALKSIAKLANKAGLKVVAADLENSWKVLEGTTLYIKNGSSPEIMFQLICHELAYIALVKDGVATNTAYSLAAISAYCVGIANGLQMPTLSAPHKLVACDGQGLLPNVDKSIKVAKRILKALDERLEGKKKK